MGQPVPVVVMGLGFIGQQVARAVQASSEVRLVGAVDAHPSLAGRKLGDVLGSGPSDVKVSARLEDVRARTRGAVLLHATGSRLPAVLEQLLEAIELGMGVVSTCEELAFPYLKHPALAERLDRAAKRSKVAVLGTGVNPGFVLDRLVATVGQAVGTVRRVEASRVVDARTRREALQRKVGAGLSEAEFDALAEKDQLGHVGLIESAALCALGLGMDCDDFEEELVPVIAEEDITGGAFPVRKGRVAGIFQTAVGLDEGQERVRLELTIALGAEPTRDVIRIEADSHLELEVKGGCPGDSATAHLVVNASPRVAAAEPGLLTVLELPAGR